MVAHQPNYGWATQTLNITDSSSTTIPITLALEPLATNFTDANGNYSANLTDNWSFLGSNSSVLSNSSLTTETSTSQTSLDAQPPDKGDPGYALEYLDWSVTLPPQQTLVGQVYSTLGLNNTATFSLTAAIDSEESISGGVLQYLGQSTRTYSCTSPMPTVNNGESYNCYSNLVYDYEEWTVYILEGLSAPEVKTVETWSLNNSCNIDQPYFGINEPQPMPSFHPIGTAVNNYLSSIGTLSNNYSPLTINGNTYNGAGWTVGTAVQLSGGWTNFQGSVSLGASYTLTTSSSYSNEYSIELQGGRYVLISEWNKPNGGGYSMVLSFQNDYWAQNIVSQSKVNNANNIVRTPGTSGAEAEMTTENTNQVSEIITKVGNDAERNRPMAKYTLTVIQLKDVPANWKYTLPKMIALGLLSKV